jgi:DNA polymerase-4
MPDTISSVYFIPRDKDKSSRHYKRVRMMPLYSFPSFKWFNWKIREHTGRYFIHFDLDAFFAQVEQRDNPNLKGKPVGVVSIADTRTKGIVMTSSYEARAVGVDTAMSTLQALQIYPDLICVPCYGQKYEAILFHIFDMIKEYVPEDCIEQYSIDECFVDLSPVCRNWSDAINLSLQIKADIKKYENLTTSMGLSYNKTYSKIATKLHKPDGFTYIKKEWREDMLYPLSVNKIWGIASRNERRLNVLGINTIGDLANFSTHALRQEFGINGIVFGKMARGEDTSEIIHERKKEKMLGHQHSMTNAICDEEEIMNELKRLSEYVCRKMRARKLVAGRMVLTIRFEDLSYDSAEAKLGEFTSDDRDIFSSAKKLYRHLYKPTFRNKAMAFGIAVFELERDLETVNYRLFEKKAFVPYHLIDKIKEKYGDNSIRIGVCKF